MGLLMDGQWHDQWYDTDRTQGRFEREKSYFRHWITADGSAGPTGESGFEAQAGRYHLYVSTACPWSHRALIFRQIKKLSPLVGLSVVNPLMAEHGWTFAPGRGVIADPVADVDYLYQLYTRAAPHYSGRVTVPLLWDKQRATIVNNESADIMAMFNSAFDGIGARAGDYRPESLRAAMDDLNDDLYQRINNGVYRAGFATAQMAYEEAVLNLFEALGELEERLSIQRYLLGSQLTESDWRLFVTLIRFDAVYAGHFKCNVRCLADYPNLSNYVRELYQWPGVAETVDITACKMHYYSSHRQINPHGIVPVGPGQDFTAPHDRERFETAA